MSEIVIVGRMDNTLDGTFESANRVYGVDGICPTIPTCAGGGIQPKIIEVCHLKEGGIDVGNGNVQQIVYDDYNSHVRSDQKTMTTLTTNCGATALRNGVKIIEAQTVCCAERGRYNADGKIEQHLEPRSDGNTNTLTTVQKDNQVLEITADLDEIPEVFQRFVYEIDGELYLIRIRKLTPRECWRLMGFSDEDFEKAATVNSNTQLYKQAGNSIVKPVLEHLFRQFLPKSKVDSLKLKALALLG